MELRPYQKDLISNIRYSISSGNRSVCGVSGCGSGKSITAASIAKSATDKGNRVLFLVHVRELYQQIRGTFSAVGVNMNLCDVMMVQTASRRLKTMPQDYKLILCDECHHSTAKTYRKVFDHYSNAIRIGFTATPIRLNRGGLGEVYQDLITSVSTKWLIENHYLAPYKYYSVKLADASGLHTSSTGDYKQNEVAELMQDKEIYGDTVKQWERLAKGKKTIVYCASVEAAEKTAEQFCISGYSSIALSAKTPEKERKAAMDAFRRGDITVLCNMSLFGEGLDVPDCECVSLLRPTQSLSLFIQQSMRSMRYMPGKTAIIIDHVGNCYRFGLPDDDREWSLEPKHVQETTVKIRICENCYAAYPPTLNKCPYCGFQAVHEIRTVNRKTVDVDLVEVARQEKIKSTKLKDADLHSWEEIEEFRELHKYNPMWAIRYCVEHKMEYMIPKSKLNYYTRGYIKKLKDRKR